MWTLEIQSRSDNSNWTPSSYYDHISCVSKLRVLASDWFPFSIHRHVFSCWGLFCQISRQLVVWCNDTRVAWSWLNIGKHYGSTWMNRNKNKTAFFPHNHGSGKWLLKGNYIGGRKWTSQISGFVSLWHWNDSTLSLRLHNMGISQNLGLEFGHLKIATSLSIASINYSEVTIFSWSHSWRQSLAVWVIWIVYGSLYYRR